MRPLTPVVLLLLAFAPTAAALGGDFAVKATLAPAPSLPGLSHAPPAAPADAGSLVELVQAPLDAAPALARANGVAVDLDTDIQAPLLGRASVGVGPARESASQAGFAEAVAPVVADAAPPALAAAGFLALLQALGVWRWLGMGAFALYSRLSKSELLDNEHRDRVYKLIQENPGLGLTEISERSGLGWGTTVYHLDRLERVGFVASERAGLHRCYFPVGTLPRESRKGIGALKADTTRAIATFLVQRPGATQSELCEALGMSASAASKQITKLESAGLVRREREWKTVRLHPEPTLGALVQPEARAVSVAAPVALPA